MNYTVNTSALPSAVKLSPEQATRLRVYNHEKLVIAQVMQDGFKAVMDASAAQSMAAELKAQAEFKSVLSELGLDPLAFNYTADLHDVESAYLVDGAELQAELTRLDEVEHAQIMEGAKGNPGDAESMNAPVSPSDPVTPS